ncbi:MAG: hypothetical protein P9X22_02305 [Candidatus Zapsychrus exili]|nr:hypothetical protein [Candidatus Zapsychrus exili]
MTLIIGIKCKDGIVMGSDGAATLGNISQKTVSQTIKKLQIIADSIVLGVSGPVGLGQRFNGEIASLWKNRGLSGKEKHEAMAILRRALWKHAEDELKAATVARGAIGGAALQSAISNVVLAVPVSGHLCLFQFDQQCSPEEVTEYLPFVAIGSGQNIADPFLAFIRRIFWPDRLPSIEEGVFAVVWTLEHAILTNPGGIGEPKQIVVYPNEEKKIEELSRDLLKEATEACHSAEKHLSDFPKTLEEEIKGEEKEKTIEIPELNSK